MAISGVRADAWVWAVRLYKTRTQATAACRAGHVRVNGDRVKPAAAIRVGDRVDITGAGRVRNVEVRALVAKRVGADVAVSAYTDHTPPPPPRTEQVALATRERGAGRPTKRERRQLDRLRGR